MRLNLTGLTTLLENAPPPAILFVRSKRDLFVALQQVNRLLEFRRVGRGLQEHDPILAVCFSRELESMLLRVQTSIEESPSPHPCLCMHETFSLAGVWSLFWIRTQDLSTAGGRREQREVILRSLLTLWRKPEFRRCFHLVYSPEEAPDALEQETLSVEQRYVRKRDALRFRQDGDRGLYCEQATSCAS